MLQNQNSQSLEQKSHFVHIVNHFFALNSAQWEDYLLVSSHWTPSNKLCLSNTLWHNVFQFTSTISCLIFLHQKFTNPPSPQFDMITICRYRNVPHQKKLQIHLHSNSIYHYLRFSSIEVHLDLGLLLMAIHIILELVKTLPLSSFLSPSPNPTLNYYLVLPYMTDIAPTLDKRAVVALWWKDSSLQMPHKAFSLSLLSLSLR